MDWTYFNNILSIPQRKPTPISNYIKTENENQRKFLSDMDTAYSTFLESQKMRDYETSYKSLLNYYSLLMGLILQSKETKLTYRNSSKIFLAEWSTICGEDSYSYTNLEFERCMTVAALGVVLSRRAEDLQKRGKEDSARKKFEKCVSLFIYLSEIAKTLNLDCELPLECTEEGALSLSKFFKAKKVCVILQKLESTISNLNTSNPLQREKFEGLTSRFKQLSSYVSENLDLFSKEILKNREISNSFMKLDNAINSFKVCAWTNLQLLHFKSLFELDPKFDAGKSIPTLIFLKENLKKTFVSVIPDQTQIGFQRALTFMLNVIDEDLEKYEKWMEAAYQVISDSPYDVFVIITGGQLVGDQSSPWYPYKPIYFPERDEEKKRVKKEIFLK